MGVGSIPEAPKEFTFDIQNVFTVSRLHRGRENAMRFESTSCLHAELILRTSCRLDLRSSQPTSPTSFATADSPSTSRSVTPHTAMGRVRWMRTPGQTRSRSARSRKTAGVDVVLRNRSAVSKEPAGAAPRSRSAAVALAARGLGRSAVDADV